MDNITVYSTAACPFCMRAKDLLEKKGAGFTTKSEQVCLSPWMKLFVHFNKIVF